jgi:hypothetical protein
MTTKPPTTKEQLETIVEQLANLSQLNALVEIVPDIQLIVKDRQEAEAVNKRFAKIGRHIVVVAGAIATIIGTIWAVSKLIFTLGNNP